MQIPAAVDVTNLMPVYRILQHFRPLGNFKAAEILLRPGDRLVKEEMIIVRPVDPDHGNISITTISEPNTIIIRSAEGPAREFAKALKQECLAQIKGKKFVVYDHCTNGRCYD